MDPRSAHCPNCGASVQDAVRTRDHQVEWVTTKFRQERELVVVACDRLPGLIEDAFRDVRPRLKELSVGFDIPIHDLSLKTWHEPAARVRVVVVALRGVEVDHRVSILEEVSCHNPQQLYADTIFTCVHQVLEHIAADEARAAARPQKVDVWSR